MNFIRKQFLKNLRVSYYVKGYSNLYLPSALCMGGLGRRMERASDEDLKTIKDRGDYYFKSDKGFDASAGTSLEDFRRDRCHRRKTNYFLDLYEWARHFDRSMRFFYRFGDTYSIPAVPTFLKAREIGEGNGNGVLMKLNKVRHFCFIDGDEAFEGKRDQVVWRGNGKQAQRQELVRKFHAHPLCDVGQTNEAGDVKLRKPYLSMAEQLRCKFILSIEGNDVATNLKWIMSSQSVCFMARPTRETWFMEGRLVPDVHYVLVKDDYSDLEEKLEKCLAEPEWCREIIRNANAHVAPFRDRELEGLIQLYVLDKYFALSGQVPRLGFFPLGREGRGRC